MLCFMIYKTIIYIFSFKKLENIVSKCHFKNQYKNIWDLPLKNLKRKLLSQEFHVLNNLSDNLVKK